MGGQNLERQKTAFAIYDRAGSESSSDGFVIAGTHVDKAFVFAYGMGHRDFLGLPDGPVIGDGTVSAGQVDAVRTAVADCPERAITIED